jgi:hypothetical protein
MPHCVPYRCREHLSIRDVAVTVTRDRRDAVDAEGEVRAGSHETNLLGGLGQLAEGFYGFRQSPIVHRTDAKVEVLERRCGELSQLGHGGVGPA